MNPDELTMTDKPTVTVAAAKRLDRKILTTLDGMETYSLELWESLSEMRETLAYKHLGFKTWAEYLTDRTQAYSHIKVTRAQLVWTLWDDGHSQRDIAEKLNVEKRTVGRDLAKRNQDQVGHNAPASSKGRDGKTYTRERSSPTPKLDTKTRVRPWTETEKNAFCGDGWNQGYKFLLEELKGALDNPTYEQLTQLESLLRRTLVKVNKLKEAIEKANS